MPLVNKRSVRDINTLITQALPAAGATVTSASLDLGTTTAFRVPGVELLLAVPATPNLADTKNITFTVQHSVDNATFVAVPGLAAATITGAGGAGAAATLAGTAPFQTKLPLGLNRYVRVVAVADSAAGNSTGVSFTFGPVF